jgi:hypothetical protein
MEITTACGAKSGTCGPLPKNLCRGFTRITPDEEKALIRVNPWMGLGSINIHGEALGF